MTTNGTISQRKLVGYATNLEISDGDSAYDTLAEVSALIEAGTASASFHAANAYRSGSGSKHAAAPHGNHNFDRRGTDRY